MEGSSHCPLIKTNCNSTANSLQNSDCLTRRVGMERSKVEVQFRDINFEAEVLVGSAGLPTVGNSFKKLALVKSDTSQT